MSENNNSPNLAPLPGDNSVLVIPAFGKSPALSLDMGKTREAETRLIEAKTVNPSSYNDLEYCFNEAYRELKKNLSTIGYQLALADKALETAKSDILLDKYPEFLKDKPKTSDNGDLRKAYMMRDTEYLAALDRINQLKAVESFVDGRIRVMENVCRYMRKSMDLIIRSGVTPNMYITSGKK